MHAVARLEMQGLRIIRSAQIFEIGILLFDPIAPLSRRHLVFNLAGGHTTLAIYARGGIYHHR
jgi:hypothetical protein